MNRYDFIYLFEAHDANPNGDPDAGNLPRVDAETGHGLVTDVCLKRKIRNFVTLTKGLQSPYGIYVAEAAVLGQAHLEAFKKQGINLGEDSKAQISEEAAEAFNESSLPDGLRVEEDEDEVQWLILEGTADKKVIKEWLKDSELSKAYKGLVTGVLKGAKGRKPTRGETLNGRSQMCEDYFDVRTFGAVMSLKSAPNCGQVRGPVQISFSRSIDPIVTSEFSITRCAVATEREAEKQSGDNRTMGRKFTVPYALYRAHGFINPFLAAQTGFSDEDRELLFTALENAFQFDQSAARPAGSMAPRGLLVFEHSSQLGNAPSHALFDAVKVTKKADVEAPRSFADYDVTIDESAIPAGVTLIRRI